jgi:hypothetical protein
LGGGVQDDRPREEELKPVTITLPKLPELGEKIKVLKQVTGWPKSVHKLLMSVTVQCGGGILW